MSERPGLRERKKQRTRETIIRVSIDLFASRGYHATTLGEIAAAADVSTRTIFSYFSSKEEILFSDFPALKAMLARELDERPEGKDALDTIRGVILSLHRIEKDELQRRREQIVNSDEGLRSHRRARLAELEELVATAIARDVNAAHDDLRPRLVAASLIAAFEALDTEGAAAWEDPSAVVDPIIAFLRGGLAALGTRPIVDGAAPPQAGDRRAKPGTAGRASDSRSRRSRGG